MIFHPIPPPADRQLRLLNPTSGKKKLHLEIIRKDTQTELSDKNRVSIEIAQRAACVIKIHINQIECLISLKTYPPHRTGILTLKPDDIIFYFPYIFLYLCTSFPAGVRLICTDYGMIFLKFKCNDPVIIISGPRFPCQARDFSRSSLSSRVIYTEKGKFLQLGTIYSYPCILPIVEGCIFSKIYRIGCSHPWRKNYGSQRRPNQSNVIGCIYGFSVLFQIIYMNHPFCCIHTSPKPY